MRDFNLSLGVRLARFAQNALKLLPVDLTHDERLSFLHFGHSPKENITELKVDRAGPIRPLVNIRLHRDPGSDGIVDLVISGRERSDGGRDTDHGGRRFLFLAWDNDFGAEKGPQAGEFHIQLDESLKLSFELEGEVFGKEL